MIEPDPRFWQSRFLVPADTVELFLTGLEEAVVSVAAFERQTLDGSDGAVWQVELLHQGEPEGDELQSWLEPLAEAAGLAPIEVSVAPLPATDWLASTASSFPPQRIGRFWIHGSHIEQPPPADAVPIRIDAGLAFGSGEHATTQGCLLALDQLARRRRFRRVLDLGSGSGILAIAAAKCWPARVVAADHDPSAPPVAAANSADNGVGHHIEHLQSEGFANRAIRRHGPYDLIMANILAEPLIELARPLVRHLAPDGTVILSGLLDRQAARVGAAYRAMGLSVRDQHPIGIWTTLVMARTRRR